MQGENRKVLTILHNDVAGDCTSWQAGQVRLHLPVFPILPWGHFRFWPFRPFPWFGVKLAHSLEFSFFSHLDFASQLILSCKIHFSVWETSGKNRFSLHECEQNVSKMKIMPEKD
jgi:hypothetical protein